jgi:7-cyano-7-deazaguanine reductase
MPTSTQKNVVLFVFWCTSVVAKRIAFAPTYATPRAMTTRPNTALETFPNPRLGRDFNILFDCPEFTCLCPITGQPDFATIVIDYVPDKLCVELKSLKLYLWSYRDQGAFHEAVTNQICDDIVKAISPRRITVNGKFWVRGGITTTVIVTHSNL